MSAYSELSDADRMALRDQFQRDGIVRVKGLLDPALLAECRRCYDWSVANPSPLAQILYPGTRHQHFVDFTNPAADAMYRSLVHQPVFADVLANLMGSEHVWYYSEEIFAKRGALAGRTVWHQDTSYHPWGGLQWANIWISFESLPAHNSLEVVRGSHLGPQYDGAGLVADPEGPPTPLHGGQWLPLPDIERERSEAPGSWDILSYAGEPGDVIILNSRALHGGAPVDEATPDRSTLVLRFYGDDAFYQPLPHDTKYFLKGEDVYKAQWGHLKPGDPIRSPLFEQIR